MKERAELHEDGDSGTEAWDESASAENGRPLTRAKLLAGAAGAGLAAGVLPGVAGARSWTPQARNKALGTGLAPGMIGGPTGFKGAARYQYPANSEEGRAITALKAMKRAGNAPDELVVQALDFARPQLESPFPKGALSTVKLFEKETGIKIRFVETSPAQEYQTNLRNASTKNKSFDLVTFAIEEMGDFAEAGLIRPLDDYVRKYKPSWNDPKFGYAGGASTVTLFTKYKGRTYAVAFDNDTQPHFYRSDIFSNPREKGNFEDKYGHELRPPLTWNEHREVAEFFTRPNAKPPLYGDVMTYAPFWSVVNFNERFVCSGNPNMYYFKDDGSANVNNDAGVRAFEEILRNLQYHGPGSLQKDWLGTYQLFGAGSAVMNSTFPNMSKILPGSKQLDTANVGRFIRSDVTPGRVVGGRLIRRPVIFYNITYGVNAYVDKKRQEAAYLFLQWAGGARIYTWLTFNPNGYQDPHHTYSFEDPYVAQSYGPQSLGAFAQIVPRSAPPITIRGGSEYRQSVSDLMQKVLTKQINPEQAAKQLSDAWNKTTNRLGQANQAAAWKTLKTAFPTVTDKPNQSLKIKPVSTRVR